MKRKNRFLKDIKGLTPIDRGAKVTMVAFDDNVKHTNEQGGTQTKLPVRLDLVPASALLTTAEVLAEGAEKYGEWNWENIAIPDHINHALTHLYRYLDGDISEKHLAHACCRVLFALHLQEKEPF